MKEVVARPEDRAKAVLALQKIREREEFEARVLGEKPFKDLIPDVDFGAWIAKARPEWKWTARHFVAMQAVLNRITAGEIKLAYFQIPIRHGKTEHNTIAYAVYRLKRDPTCRILVASYNQRRANKFSRQIKRLYIAQGGEVSRDISGTTEWETPQGGGVLAVGAGVGIASVNADLVIIDDPIGGRADAESQAKRDEVWDWLTNDILARLEPHTAVIFTMSRWHMDDPAGRLIKEQGSYWTILDLPGEAEAADPEKGIPPDPLGREVGEPLWPELRGKAFLEDRKRLLRPYGYASLIQGRPRPREGGMFKYEWWIYVPTIPLVGPMVRYWDLAGTELRKGKNDPDFSAGVLVARMPDRRTAVCDVRRFQYSVARRDAEILKIAAEDKAKYGSRVVWWFEQETGINGKERTKYLIKEVGLLGITVRAEPATGSKYDRAEPVAGQVEAGNIVLVRAPWNEDFIGEHADFTGDDSGHDDQVDGLSGGFAKLGAKGYRLFTGK